MMKGLSLLAAMVIVGLFTMFISSYKLLTELGAARAGGVMDPGLKMYVVINYVGLGLFLLGALGALLMLVRSFIRKG